MDAGTGNEAGGPDSARRPTLSMLSQPMVERIVGEALEVLARVGVLVEDDEALAVLAEGGAQVHRHTQRAKIPENLVWDCLKTAPSSITVYNRDGEPTLRLQGWNVYFDPGSAAIKILDSQTQQARQATTTDLVNLVRLADALPHLAAQSTALVVSDVPREIADRYRLFLVLLNSSKPVITGTFTLEAFEVMKEMLAAVMGGASRLAEKPPAIFDACPSPPLKWSRLTVRALMECARSGLPAELVSMPLFGATSPATLAGALVQHTAENLSGVVIHQLTAPGSPIIYGGSPAVFDMRFGTTAMGAIETAMVVCAYAQIGRFLGLPTHGYLGQSDAKLVDCQAGLESSPGLVLAALAGVNVVSGAGMLEFESCQSLEKLVIDDEICGMALRLVQGIEGRDGRLAEDLWGDLGAGDHFLTSPVTLRWLREETLFPSAVIDRRSRDAWLAEGATTAWDRAQCRVRELLERQQPKPLADEVRRELIKIMHAEAKRYGVDALPGI